MVLRDWKRKYIAKFSGNNDLFSVFKAVFIAMRLARKAGLNLASVALRTAMGKDVLSIERFDRVAEGAKRRRRAMVSALTWFELI